MRHLIPSGGSRKVHKFELLNPAKCRYPLVSIIKMKFCATLLIWMLVIFCLADLGNMMWMLLIKAGTM
ncbi:hypothetical protein RchiOBHm_Chr2g0152081 [Rosa chinensis]|uniref:Uncharacterized protein n=1 Tax=Rosa chinensis TaxID=74649 RepID=A0A2P6S0C5_ROSCH|nr:hypothetical protein RchiOBHm_Chr2g0152081 [Rosa chinensis]